MADAKATRTVWADATGVLIAALEQELHETQARLSKQIKAAKARCNHAYPDGRSAIGAAPSLCGGGDRCEGCGDVFNGHWRDD